MNAYRYVLSGWDPEPLELADFIGEPFDSWLELHGFSPYTALKLGHSPNCESFEVEVFEHRRERRFLVEITLGSTLEYAVCESVPALLALLAALSPVVLASIETERRQGETRQPRTRHPLVPTPKPASTSIPPDPWLSATSRAPQPVQSPFKPAPVSTAVSTQARSDRSLCLNSPVV